MRFASLGSGSNGNALLVEARSGLTTTRILLDCGFSLRETEKKLARLSLSVDDLQAIVVTHEHMDHIGGVFAVARHARLPVFMSWGTAQAVGATPVTIAAKKIDGIDEIDMHILSDDQTASVGDLEILPYTVPHDAREPLQPVFSDGLHRLGVLTDAGSATPHIIGKLTGCDALVLECNYDQQLLVEGHYPPSLKARIKGAYGHLANDTAAEILRSIDQSHLKHIVAAHLSQENNRPDLAQSALANVLDVKTADIITATQQDGFPWLTL